MVAAKQSFGNVNGGFRLGLLVYNSQLKWRVHEHQKSRAPLATLPTKTRTWMKHCRYTQTHEGSAFFSV